MPSCSKPRRARCVVLGSHAAVHTPCPMSRSPKPTLGAVFEVGCRTGGGHLTSQVPGVTDRRRSPSWDPHLFVPMSQPCARSRTPEQPGDLQPGLQGHRPPVRASVREHSLLSSPRANQHTVPLSCPQRGHRETFWTHRTPLSTLGEIIIYLLISHAKELQGSFPPGMF